MSYQFPAFRRLRGYAFDPSLNLQMDTALINQVTFKVPWEVDAAGNELLKPGPEGEYVKVVDQDQEGALVCPPVDLGDEQLIAQDGLAPSESNPQFHQQMVYAVAMTTIGSFERALRRRVLWSPERVKAGRRTVETYVPQLRLYPHAFGDDAYAHYYSEQKAVLMGYLPAPPEGRGGAVFVCLSHDVIAHEVTHALIDGIHPELARKSDSLDASAFHEGFADLVAYFQHFTFPEVVRHQIAKTRGNLLQENFLLQIAGELGRTVGGGRKALRDVLGETDEKGSWIAREPDPAELDRVTDRYERGGILVRAVFGAFFSIYESRIADLRRIASNGTGVLPQGELHPDLVSRLADEASRVAEILLGLCIRALDYCPPRSIDFGEFLRALITADYDLFPEDERVYRVALIESFRRHGIHPRGARTLSLESLRWPTPEPEVKLPQACLKLLLPLARKWSLDGDRSAVFALLQETRERLRRWLSAHREDLRLPGLDLGPGKRILVTSLRPVRRLAADGQPVLEMVVELGGSCGDCALLVDLETGIVRYSIGRQTAAGDAVMRANAGNVGDMRLRRAPAFRRLRGYAFDPSLSSQHRHGGDQPGDLPGALGGAGAAFRQAELRGPVGEYLEVVDYDPASGCFYAPVDLNDRSPAGAGRAAAFGGEPAVPPADGLRRGDDAPSATSSARWAAGPSGRPGRATRTAAAGRGATCSGCASIRTPCARPTPTTARRRRRCSSATSRPRRPIPGDNLPGRHWSSPACRTTSSPTRRRTRCSTACTAASPSRPTPTSSPSTRRSPTSWRCSSTSPSRRSCAHQIASTRGDLATPEPAGRARPAVRPGDRQPRRPARRHRPGRPGDAASGSPQAPDPADLREPTRAARPRRHPGGGGLRRLPLHLQGAHRRPAADRHRRHRRAARRGASTPTWSNRLARRGRASRPSHVLTHVHPRARLLPAGGHHLRRLPARPDHRRLRPGARRRPAATASRSIEAFRRRGIYPRDVRTPLRSTACAGPPRPEAAGDEGFRGILSAAGAQAGA